MPSQEAQSLLSDGDRLLGEGQLDAAAHSYERALELDPTLAAAHHGLAEIALEADVLDEALAHAEAAVKLSPDQSLSHALLGLAFEARGEEAKAELALKKAAELGPELFVSQFNRGRLLARAGKFEDALPYLEKCTRLEPEDPNVWEHYGLALTALGQSDRARAALERSRDLDPEDPERWGFLVDLPFNARDYGAAKKLVDQGLAACGDEPVLLEKGLACALMLKDTEAGLDYVRRELAVAPEHAQGYLNLARLHLLAGQYDESVRAAESLLQREPDNAEAHFHLGNVWDARRETAKAEAAYRSALAHAPGDWRIAANLAGLLLTDGKKPQFEEAKGLLTRVLDSVPEGEHRPLYNLALAHVRLGDKQAARELAARILRQARGNDPIAEEARRLIANLEGS